MAVGKNGVKLFSFEEGDDVVPAEGLGELEGCHAVGGEGGGVGAGVEEDLDGGGVAGECFLVEEGEAVVVGAGEHFRGFGEGLRQFSSHALGHGVLARGGGHFLFRGGADADDVGIAEIQAPGLVVLVAGLGVHPRAHEVDGVAAIGLAGDDEDPVGELLEGDMDVVTFLDGGEPVGGVGERAVDELAVEDDIPDPHVFDLRSVFGLLFGVRGIGECDFDEAHFKGRDDAALVPGDFPPEVAEGGLGVCIGLLHGGVGAVETEDLRGVGLGHDDRSPERGKCDVEGRS
jgi:hypothetical protein